MMVMGPWLGALSQMKLEEGVAVPVHPGLQPVVYGLGSAICLLGLAGAGFIQWLFLRRRLPRAGWWLLAFILGAAPPMLMLSLGAPATANWTLFAGGLGLLSGASTGVVLALALQKVSDNQGSL